MNEKSGKTTQRTRFIERASLLIRDSGNGDLSDFRIAEAMNGVAEIGGHYKKYSDSVALGSRAERLLINDIRRAVENHPLWKAKAKEGITVEAIKEKVNQLSTYYRKEANAVTGKSNGASAVRAIANAFEALDFALRSNNLSMIRHE